MRSLRVSAVLALLLLVAGAAAGGVLLRQDVEADLHSQAAPATLAAGSTGTTTIGTSQASATTSASALALAASTNILDIDRNAQDWSVRVEAISISGFGVLDTATVRLTDGTDTATQVTVDGGSLTQTTGTTLDLLATTDPLEIMASAAKSSLNDNVIEMDIVLTGAGGNPELRYPYTLTIT